VSSHQLVQMDDRAKRLLSVFKTNSVLIMKGAPRGLDGNRLLAIAFNHIAYDPALLDCTVSSIVGGVFEAVKLGITIGGPMQESWLIPFKAKGSSGKVATLIVGYQGYRNIIDRGRAVIDLHPRAVHVDDEFDYWYGDNPRIQHRPKMPMPEVEADLKAVYAVANLRGGGRQFEVLLKAEVDSHRKRSRAGQSGPWVTDYVPMALKTAVRKLAKYVPKSSELLARALELDENADRGVDQVFDVSALELPSETDPEPSSAGKGLQDLTHRLAGTQPAPATPPSAADIGDLWAGDDAEHFEE